MEKQDSTRTARILVADHADQCREYQTHLSKAGWHFDILPPDKEAIEAVQSLPYDVVLTGLDLSSLSGLGFLSQVRAKCPDQVVIVVASQRAGEKNRSVEDVIAALRAGGTEVVFQPVDARSLNLSIDRAIRNSQREIAEENGLRRLTSFSREYVFTTADLVRHRFSLDLEDALCRVGRIDQDTRNQLELAFQEAMSNSLDHGNLELESAWREDIDSSGVDRYSRVKQERLSDEFYALRKIFLKCSFDSNQITIQIRDQGRGFSRGAISSATTSPESLLCHGRGLSIIKQCVDQVTYNTDGSEITLVKKLSPQ